MAARLDDLKNIRRFLDKSQSEMAELLGISVRAVQSYEQGWRVMPCRVQQLSALLVYLNWRKQGHRQKPCWKIKKCSAEAKSNCSAYEYHAGDMCWLLQGTSCDATKDPAVWRDKTARCQECLVLQEWWPKDGAEAADD